MKPRILILMHYLELGGAEMALIGLLHALDPERTDVDLFVYDHRGPLMKFIPDWVNLLSEIGAYTVMERPLSEAVRRRYFGVAFGRLAAKLRHRAFVRKNRPAEIYSSLIQYVGDLVTPWLPDINPAVEYDMCISFLAPHNIARDKVRARRHVAWIHTDYSTVDIDVADELKVWSAFDSIVSISPQVTNAFTERFPSLSSRIVEIENILPTDYIISRSEEFSADRELKGCPALLSIGRFCPAKNYDNLPFIAKNLVDTSCPELRWYIIGSGIDEPLIRQRIKEAGMEKNVILLGPKENPYPYIKACDIYVQPSRYEGKSVTVREAQMLGKPVAVTAYPTAPSQIRHGVDGVIVPLDNEGCAAGLAELIRDVEKQKSLAEYCLSHDFGNESEVEKIYKLIR
ncbi:MAG: glycosyltransferase [Muribaculaceae bacterium]|nr:glycosyltransferase [Muribaculaceae bacterium]